MEGQKGTRIARVFAATLMRQTLAHSSGVDADQDQTKTPTELHTCGEKQLLVTTLTAFQCMAPPFND
jgi:hypothetical protein